MRTLPKSGLTTAVFISVACSHAFADNALDALQSCVSEQDDIRRLSCYDRVMSRPATPAGQVSGLTSAAGVPKAATNPAVPKPSRVTAKVIAITQGPHREVIVTLENQQVWAEQDAEGYFPVKVGESVTVKPGLLGGFLLIANGRSIRVTREK